MNISPVAYRAFLPSVTFIVFFAVFLGAYSVVNAQGNVDAAANAQCQTLWNGFLKNPCKGKTGCANSMTLGKGCSGSACSGTCNFPMRGGGTATGGAQKAMDMAKKIADMLKKPPGGGGAPPPPPAGGFSPPKEDEKNKNTLADSLLNSIFGGTSTSSSSATDIVSDILGSFGIGAGSQAEQAESETGTTTEEILENEAGDQQTQGPEVVIKEQGIVKTPTSETVSISGIEEKTDTSIGGFFGRFFNTGEQQVQADKGNTFFGRLCTARPWQATFVTRIFSASFFDSLCIRQGYALGNVKENIGIFQANVSGEAGKVTLVCPDYIPIGQQATIEWNCVGSQSSGSGFDTGGQSSGRVLIEPTDTATYALRCANGGRAQCEIEVGKPRAQIVANPPRVQLGARTNIYWASEGAIDCTVSGPGMKEKGLRGAATSPAILGNVTYSITCSSEDGYSAYDEVVIDVGV
jgi:hypothetical protein